MCNSYCFLSPLISLHTLNAVRFCQQHLITSGTLRDSCNTLSSLHISSSSVYRHYHTVILTTSVKTTCELTATYQRKWHYKSWLTLWKSYCVCNTSTWSFRELEVGAKRRPKKTTTTTYPCTKLVNFEWHIHKKYR